MVVLLSTADSCYHNWCIYGGTSTEYFGYTLVVLSNFALARVLIMHVPIIHDHILCCAISQAVSRRHLVSYTRIQAEVSLCGICATENSNGTGYSQSTAVSPRVTVQLVFHIHASITGAIQSWQKTASSDTPNKSSLSHLIWHTKCCWRMRLVERNWHIATQLWFTACIKERPEFGRNDKERNEESGWQDVSNFSQGQEALPVFRWHNFVTWQEIFTPSYEIPEKFILCAVRCI
jgi:hypothetical protein